LIRSSWLRTWPSPSSLVGALLRAGSDPDGEVREQAIAALGSLETERDRDVKAWGKEALEKLGRRP
jgi:hypothetical protein